ncbi:Zinc finger, GATA-type [Dillenia turbinata]|uniref:GATA transcription factor n=1 Tax=Dillenia turbinata TaxID=194707 RepID=A0AAN8ZBB4_9MAGN
MEAPEYLQTNYYQQFTPERANSKGGNNNDHFIVEELLDFSNEDDAIITETSTFDHNNNNNNHSNDSSTVTVVDSCNSSSFSAGYDPNLHVANINFSGDLSVPYDDLAELEWLSNFVEESFSSEDLQKLQLISGMKARPDESSETTREFQPETARPNPMLRPEMSVPAKARSKRSRAAPCNWTSRLLVLSPTTSSSENDVVPPTPVGKKTPKASAPRKKEGPETGQMAASDGRKCLHCATDKTPQWRTGPMGPKTLCNACGVRYKSGRLVPEYRPAASPTFVLTRHSNSHRKVLELRRQKELMGAAQMQQQPQHGQPFLHHPNMVFDVSNGDDYLIHQHVGPDFRQMI